MPEGTVSILIVDDHEVVRMGLRTLLERRPRFPPVGEAGGAPGARPAAPPPPLAITDGVLERLRRLASGEGDELSTLSPQERKILTAIAEGKTNKEIAQEVFLSDKTVKNYVSSILSKLNLLET